MNSSKPRVRFAPSPTGYLHIGGARTALYNYFFAKATGGTFILRIEDTDAERSQKEYEKLQIEDMHWLGLEFDEGPEMGGEFGPYRQSERQDIYLKYAQKLVDEGKAYYCFCSEEELEKKKENALQEGRPPHYDGKCRNLSSDETSSKLSAGEKAVVRFKAYRKPYVLNDHVRGKVVFPDNMVGDFVLLRSGNMPVYNYCCVIDDWLMQITHVIRGEDHLSNTVRQLMIYEALGVEKVPEFAHLSLLVGKDRQKLSKRHGVTSVKNYREESYLPSAMVNYLCLLGWSHPEEKEIFDGKELSRVFTLDRFSKSPAVFDIEKFQWVNGQHLRAKTAEELLSDIVPFIAADHIFHKQTHEWKIGCLNLFKEQIQFYNEITAHLDEIFFTEHKMTEELQGILSWPTTPQIINYLKQEVAGIQTEFPSLADFEKWGTHIKSELKIKGKELFMGMRAALTGRGHGPELKFVIPLTPTSVIKKRLENLL
ncbi:MAG: glutamate--tRNA ligase [Bacteriovoracaceae bacterium]|nr:glutamate--tRNA ligase [Bacteriovoracaceae bacterium]